MAKPGVPALRPRCSLPTRLTLFPGHPIDAVPALCPCPASRIPQLSLWSRILRTQTRGGPGRFHAQWQLLHFQTARPAEVADRTVERGLGPSRTQPSPWAASRCLVLPASSRVIRCRGLARAVLGPRPGRSGGSGILTGSDSAAEKASYFLHRRKHLVGCASRWGRSKTGEGSSRLGVWASQIL